MVLKADIPHILAVDDDDRIRRLLAQYLDRNGYLVITAGDAAEARAALKNYAFDLCVVDVMMPGESGLDLAAYIARAYECPVILLTAMTETADRIAGLETGADDYICKPFEPQELLLRIRAVLKRSMGDGGRTTALESSAHPETDGAAPGGVVRMHNRTFDPAQDRLTDGEGRMIPLTDGDIALLRALSSRPNMPIRREMLAARLGDQVSDRAVDVQVTRLRRKLEPDPANPSIIVTRRGKGYMLRTES